MDIYYVRHGEPDYEHDALTEIGHYQAEETSKFLVNIKFDKIFASSHGRAVQTAEHLTSKNHMEINKVDWAMEGKAWDHMSALRNDGARTWIFYAEKTKQKLSELIADENWYDDPIFKPDLKEYIFETRKIVDEWLLSMNIKHENGKYEIIGKTPDNIALFAHGGFGILFASLMLDMNYPKTVFNIGQLSCCGIYHFRVDDKGITLVSNNKTYYK